MVSSQEFPAPCLDTVDPGDGSWWAITESHVKKGLFFNSNHIGLAGDEGSLLTSTI